MAKKIAKAPVEWVDGKIVLPAPPANPLKGKGNQKWIDRCWGVTGSLFDWFYKHLEDRHKNRGRILPDPDFLRDDNFNDNFYAISPEANKLLEDKLDFWKERAREDSKLRREQKKQEMEGGDFETPPGWVGGKIVLPKPSESSNKKHFWRPNFDGENYKAVLWFRDHLPETHQGQIDDPRNGHHPKKTMSTEARELWFKHKGFWLAQYYIPIKENVAQKKEQASAVQETLKNASAKAGVSLKELNKKLEKLSILAKGENVQLAIGMVADFDDVWLFESLLAGSTIDKDGYLIPGKPLKMFKKNAEFFGILALVNAPESTNLHASLNKTKLRYFKSNNFNEEILDLYAEHIIKKHPDLRSIGNLYLGNLRDLSDAAAESLSKHKGDLHLKGLASLSDTAAEFLSKHKGWLSLEGLTSLSDAAAESLSRHEEHLSLDGLTSLSDEAAESLSKHDSGLNLRGLKSLSDAAAESLSKHKGELSLGGLASLSDAAAESLSRYEGHLSLDGLTSLSDSANHIALAKKLASQNGPLYLSELTSLSDGAAEALSKCDGDFDLKGLKSLSDTGAQALAKKKGGKNKMRLPLQIQNQVDKYKKK